MTIKFIRLILLIVTTSQLVGCYGQSNSKDGSKDNEMMEVGEKASKIDQQIWAVYQDKVENYWFGSNGQGLYKYNGNTLIQMTTKDGLIDNQIRGIQEDKQGNLYVETPTGVSKFDGSKFTTLSVVESPQNTWKLEPDDLWFNCNGNAHHIYRYDGEKLYELQLPKMDLEGVLGIREEDLRNDPYTVFGIDKDKSGNLWIGTVLAGAFRFDGESFLWIGEKELSRLPDGREPGVRSILEDDDGFMWLSNFLSKYRVESDILKKYEKHKAVDIPKETVRDKILYFNSGLVDHHGNLWMTTYGGGVWKYDGNNISNFEINNGEEDILLICFYQDKKGTIWLGTNNDGVYKYNGNVFEKFEP